ncbi:MAG: TIGR00282 family metallophosphoesterase [Alphaproteobacteria bacterium]
MKILFIGDIYGRSGREALQCHLPTLKQKLTPDVTIVNVDNAANGRGITPKQAAEFYEWGADCLTGGDHIWDQRQIIPYIDKDPKLLRPINFPANTPGKGSLLFQTQSGETCLIIHALGRVFIDPADNPFTVVKDLIDRHPMGSKTNSIFIDFHAEATSEKMALAQYLDGKVSAVIGSHTHIQTADDHVMEGGTAYMTDAGMTGDYNSVIGARKDIAIHRFINKTPHPERLIPATGDATLCGALVTTHDGTGLAKAIQPIRIGGCLKQAIPEN